MRVNEISDDPWDRVHESLKRKLHENSEIGFDMHCHIFNHLDIPDGFIGIRIPMTKRYLKKLSHLLHRLNPFTDADQLDNVAYFIDILSMESDKIVEKTFGYYDYDPYTGRRDTVFCPLMMDMGPGIKSKKKICYQDQITRMQNIRSKYLDKILPFVAIDPNRERVFDLFLEAFSPKSGFFGLKIYPSLGYLPSNPTLMDIFEVCQDKNIPVTAHCGGGTVHHSSRHIRKIEGFELVEGKLRKMVVEKKFPLGGFMVSQYDHFFNHPKNWEPVLYKYPKLRLNLAHFGNIDQWLDMNKGKKNTWPSRIMVIMEKYENVYADASFMITEPRVFQMLRGKIERNKLLQERVLYGSDYFMVLVEGHFRAMKTDFETAMGDDIMQQIACKNPRRFLGLN